MALTRCAALDVAAHGIRVNAVAPSLATHPFLAKVTSEELLAELAGREAFGRAAQPWEVANVIVVPGQRLRLVPDRRGDLGQQPAPVTAAAPPVAQVSPAAASSCLSRSSRSAASSLARMTALTASPGIQPANDR